jgi:hypothetical protein
VSSRSINRSATIEGTIRYAVGQLEATKNSQNPELRLICLVNRSTRDGSLVSQQILGVLYGIRTLITSDAGKKAVSRDCLYFADSAFHHHRNGLDAAITIDGSDASLWVNDYSASADKLRESALGRLFLDHDALHDIDKLAKRGWLIADCKFNRRRDVKEIQLFVEQKYSLGQTILAERRQHAAMVVVSQQNPRSKKAVGN